MKIFWYISHPPLFEDEDETHTAALLHFILLSTTAIVILQILANAFVSQDHQLLAVNLFALPVLIGLFILMHFRYMRLSASILVIFLWLIISFVSYISTGILNPVFSAQTLTIVIAGLLINGTTALIFTVFSSAFGLWLVQAAEAGQYVSQVGDVSVRQAWIDETMFFILIALMMALSLRVIHEARLRAIAQARSQRQSDERYRSLVQSAPDIIFTIDPKHQITYMNRTTSGTIESRLGHSVYEFIHPASHDIYRTALNRVLESGSVEQIEVQNFNPSQQTFWYSVRFAPIWEDKHVVEVTAIATNITEHRGTEEALRASEEQYRELFESNPHPMAVTDLNTLEFLDVNDAALKFYGYSREEFLKLTAVSLRAPEKQASVPGEAEAFRQSPPTYLSKVTTQHLKKGGDVIWVEITGHRLKYNGRDSVVSMAYDLTERLKAEEGLRASERQYRQLFESNPNPMIITDLYRGNFLNVNDAAIAKFGYTAEEFKTMQRADLIHPHDLPKAVKLFEEFLREDSPYMATGIRRLLKKDGSLIFAEIAAHGMQYSGQDAIVAVAYDVNDRMRAEEALRESKARLNGIFDSAMDAIITIDAHQQIIYFNAAAEHMFHCTSADAIGQSLTRFIPDRFRSTHEQHIETFGRTGVTNRRMGALTPVSGLRTNGIEFPLEASISQFETATGKFFTVILRDITARKQAEDTIRSSEQLLSTVFRTIPLAIGIVSLSKGQTIMVNNYMLQLTGFAENEIIGRPIAEAPYWTQPDQWQVLSQVLRNDGNTNGVEMNWQTKSGAILNMLGSAAQVEINGEPCLLGIALDITERKQAERIRLEFYKERELLEVKARFISTMSHEFRTPLTVIMSSKETLLRYYDRLTPERRVEHFNNIHNQIRYVTNLLDEVLTLSKAQAGKMAFNPAPMNLPSFCKTLFEQMQTTDTQQHEFTLIIEEAIGEIAGDVNLLQHVLVNLLSNAIKYSPEGGEVRFELRLEGEQVVLSISDQGIGIPEEDQKHLFEPFYRATNTGTIKGTGLGLAIVKESVEAHGGTINVISVPGEGTTFVVRLPLAATA